MVEIVAEGSVVVAVVIVIDVVVAVQMGRMFERIRSNPYPTCFSGVDGCVLQPRWVDFDHHQLPAGCWNLHKLRE